MVLIALHPRQGGAPVSGDQVSVWTPQNALPRVGQEHEPVAGDVCAVQLVDGAQANYSGVAVMSAPVTWGKARKLAPRGRNSRE